MPAHVPVPSDLLTRGFGRAAGRATPLRASGRAGVRSGARRRDRRRARGGADCLMRRWLRDNGLSLAFGLIFLLALGGQSIAGYLAAGDDAHLHAEAAPG